MFFSQAENLNLHHKQSAQSATNTHTHVPAAASQENLDRPYQRACLLVLRPIVALQHKRKHANILTPSIQERNSDLRLRIRLHCCER